jgi:hypothetical protein
MIGRGLDWLESKRRTHLARSARMRRGTLEIEITATPSRTSVTLDGPRGIERAESDDFFLAPDELAELLPLKEGDQILMPAANGDDTTRVFELCNFAGESCWRYTDSERRSIRVHTKMVGVE